MDFGDTRLDPLWRDANSLLDQFASGGKLRDLDESIQLFRTAADICPVEHFLRPTLLDRLSTSLLARFRQEGSSGDLDASITMHREALALRPVGHPDHSVSLDNLASSLVKRFEQATLVGDLTDVINLHCAMPDSRRSATSQSLAYYLLACFERNTGSRDLGEAIELHRAALDSHPEGHPDRPMTLNKLGYALARRFEDGGSEDDLNESITLLRSALALFPVEHPDYITALVNLATSLLIRFEQNGDAEDSDPQNPSASCPMHCQQTGNAEDLNESISLFRSAIALREAIKPEHTDALLGLASSLQARFRKDGGEEDFEEATQLLGRAATHSLSGSLIRLEAAHRWLALARLRDHHTTFNAYKTTISILQHSLTVRPTLSLQHDFLKKTGTNHKLPLDAASYALEKGDLGQAVELLEQGRTLIWSQMRGLRVPLDRLSEKNRPLADRFRDVSGRLESLATYRGSPAVNCKASGGVLQPGSVPKVSQIADKMTVRVRELSEEQAKIIDEIRGVVGFEDFLRSPSLETLKEAASEGPVIVINHSSFRCDVLIILSRTNEPCICIPLDQDWYEDALKLCNELVVVRNTFEVDSAEYDETLQRVMKVVWDRVVSKVVQKFRDLGIAEGSRIWWCPTSYLSSLPFHAAGPYEDPQGHKKYLLDDYTSSYTPTLMSLIGARSLANVCSISEKLLFAGDTKLQNTKEELRKILAHRLVEKCLLDDKASCKSVLAGLQTREWVHFVCHGTLDHEKPFQSSLLLPGGKMTLLDIARKNLPNAEFAFLSACNTAGQPPGTAMDEAIHLAAAIQFCGFRSVIGSMWQLLDRDGPILTEVVYSHLMRDLGEGEIRFKRAAGAVREAAIHLRSRTDLAYKSETDIKPWRWVNLVHFGA